MQELRETVATFALLIGVVASFLFVSIFAGMLLIQDRTQDLYLLKFMAVDVALIVLCFSFVAILSDNVWDKKPKI